MRAFATKRYICEINRDLHDWIEMQPNLVEKERGLHLVEEAFDAGKRMSNWMKKKDQATWKKALIIDWPWGKTWLELYGKAFEAHGYKVQVWDGKSLRDGAFDPDVVFCTWADRDYTQMFPNARHAIMMRRFELFHAPWQHFRWDKISALICCNPWIGEQASQVVPKDKIYVIPNPIDATKWTFKERDHGKKIGMACRVHPVKNLPLACQIMLHLPAEYELHIAGKIEDLSIYSYVKTVLWGRRVKFHGQMKRGKLDEWWDQMNYCLSTSISEGDPMNVLEACSKGIKPIIHNWPGADAMYPKEWVFDSTGMAVKMLQDFHYESNKYREYVGKQHSVVLADKTILAALGEL